MSKLIGIWFAAVVLMIASAIAIGISMTISTAALLLTMSIVPPAVLLFVWRGAPPPTIGELLYVVNSRKDGRS